MLRFKTGDMCFNAKPCCHGKGAKVILFARSLRRDKITQAIIGPPWWLFGLAAQEMHESGMRHHTLGIQAQARHAIAVIPSRKPLKSLAHDRYDLGCTPALARPKATALCFLQRLPVPVQCIISSQIARKPHHLTSKNRSMFSLYPIWTRSDNRS